MLRHKHPRTKGKLSLTKYFQTFEEGDKVTVVQELSVPFGYPKKVQGRTGTVIAKRGNAYYVEIKELNKPKKYVIKPIHLMKIQNQEAKK